MASLAPLVGHRAALFHSLPMQEGTCDFPVMFAAFAGTQTLKAPRGLCERALPSQVAKESFSLKPTGD